MIQCRELPSQVRQNYEAINFDQSIANEYKIARGENNMKRRVGHGVVVVKPTTHTRFYAITSAVACAIAAGNTFVVEVCFCEHAIEWRSL